MTYEEMLAMLDRYYLEDERLDDELDYATSYKNAYESYGLGIKEAYLEYVNEVNYDE